MPLYEFPSGRLFHEGQIPGEWWLIEYVLLAMLITSLALLIWRITRAATQWDYLGWTALLVTEFIFHGWLFHGETPSNPKTLFAQLSLLVPVIGFCVTVCRCIHDAGLRDFIVFSIGIGVATVLLLPSVSTPREVTRRVQCKNNLKQIGLAVFNYIDVYNQIPLAGAEMQDGGPVCSWRVSLVRYLNASPVRLNYHFNEPWDSPFNTRIQDQCPVVYHCPSHESPRRMTDYVVVRGPETVGGDGLTAIRLEDLKHGTSNTILAVEAAGTEIIWSEPKDVVLTDESVGINLPSNHRGRSDGVISSYHMGGAHSVMCDGSVRFISQQTDKQLLKQLLTINGGGNLDK